MTSFRDEYGHRLTKPHPIALSEHIEPEPLCSGGKLIDPLVINEAKIELNDYIRHLNNSYELSGSLEFF